MTTAVANLKTDPRGISQLCIRIVADAVSATIQSRWGRTPELLATWARLLKGEGETIAFLNGEAMSVRRISAAYTFDAGALRIQVPHAILEQSLAADSSSSDGELPPLVEWPHSRSATWCTEI